MNTDSKPPAEFLSIMNKLCPNKDCPADPKQWKALPEWQFFKAGYNTCVNEANSMLLKKYGIKETAERVFR